jgi:FR47-like protein
MSAFELDLEHGLVLNAERRILSTREPNATPGPLFVLARSAERCAWAVRVDVPHALARQLEQLAEEEPPARDLRSAPVFAHDYELLLRSAGFSPRMSSGPSFRFPEVLPATEGIVTVSDERLLEHHFRGWVVGEIAEGRAPVQAIIEGGYPVSVCFCARSSPTAAAAGVETAAPFRGRGFAPRVTAAWAQAIRSTGRVPLYSTSWTNTASLAVTRSLGLVPSASHWSLEG